MAYSPAITIQAGNKGDREVFCVPGAGASVTSFLPMVEALGDDVAVHGLQPRGMDGATAAHTSVSAAARAYLEAVAEIKRQGPLRVIGHSFGGWVAFELACQFVSAGAAVDSIVLLDTKAPSERPVHQRSGVDALMKLARLLEQASETQFDFNRQDLEVLDDEARLQRLMRNMQSAGLLPIRAKLDVVRSLVDVFSTNVNTAYVPSGYFDGEVVLIQPRDRLAFEDDEEAVDNDETAEAWSKYAARVRQVSVPGNHMTMLKRPGVERIATQLRRLWLM